MGGVRPIFDIDSLIDEGPWGGLQKLVLLAIVLVFLVEGFDNQVMASAIPVMAAEWKAPAHDFALPLAMGWGGAGIGTVLGGVLGDRIGRKPTLIAALLLFGVPTICVALTRDITSLVLLRLLAGVGLGSCDPAALTLLAEYTPRRRQGRAIASALLVSLIGIGGCGLLASVILPTQGWRPLFVIVGGAPVLLAIGLAVSLRESPRYLARLIRRRPELLKLMRGMGHELAADADLRVSEPPAAGPVRALFAGGLAPSTFRLWGGFVFVYLAVGVLFSWAPTLLSRVGLAVAWTGRATAAQSLGGMAGTWLGGAFSERFGGAGAARILAGASALGAVILAVTIALEPRSPFLLLALLAIEGGLLSGTMTALFASAAEIYPSASRSTGIGVAGALGRVGAIGSSYAGVTALELAGGPGYFAVTACAALLILVAVAKLRPPRASAA